LILYLFSDEFRKAGIFGYSPVRGCGSVATWAREKLGTALQLKKILAPLTSSEFAVTDLKHRLLIDDIRRRFDASKDSEGYAILAKILHANAADKKQMADVARTWSWAWEFTRTFLATRIGRLHI
jgi:hypothetical protein